ASTYNIGGNAGLSMGKGGKFILDAATYNNNAGVPGPLVPPVPTNQFNNDVEKTASSPNARQEADTQYLRTSYILPLPQDSAMTLRLFGSQRQVKFRDLDTGADTDRHE